MGNRLLANLGTLGHAILQFIYPLECSLCEQPVEEHNAPLCEKCFASLATVDQPFCLFCHKFLGPTVACVSCDSGLPQVPTLSLGAFDDSYQKLIHQLKYRNARPLGKLFGQRMAECLGQLEHFGPIDVVIPVPLHRRRKWKRGFNQSDLVAEGIAKALGKPLDKRTLRRLRHTQDHTRLSRVERQRNVAGAFGVVNPDRIQGKTVLLVDDVTTTGATLGECARTLVNAGAKRVCAAAIAVAL